MRQDTHRKTGGEHKKQKRECGSPTFKGDESEKRMAWKTVREGHQPRFEIHESPRIRGV